MPGFYWLDANGYYGAQGNPLPRGILSLESLGCYDHAYAAAFVRRDPDSQSLLQAKMEIMDILMRGLNIPTSPPSSSNAGTSPIWTRPEPVTPVGAKPDYSHFFAQTEQARKEREAREARTREEARAAEEACKARDAREATRKRQEAEAARQRQGQEAARQRQAAAAAAKAKAERHKAGWERYTRGWQTLTANKRANVVLPTSPRSQIPWPTSSGTFTSFGSITNASLELFLSYGTTTTAERKARTRAERSRWHPDQIPRLWAQPVFVDEETMRVATEISQLLNAWWDANKES